MDDAGNILIRRYSKSSVFVKSTAATSNEETAIGQDILKLPGYALEQEKIFKVSDLYIIFYVGQIIIFRSSYLFKPNLRPFSFLSYLKLHNMILRLFFFALRLQTYFTL